MSLFPKITPGWKPAAPMLKLAGTRLPHPVTLPVVIVMNSRRGRKSANGNYKPMLATRAPDHERAQLPRGTTLYHRIMLKSYLDREQANKTLWHELAHAMQAERVFDRFSDKSDFRKLSEWKLHSSGQRLWSYEERPIEIEAREIADRFAASLDLTVIDRKAFA